eukprot:142101-Alexandrium_andersonii.AAC.1
MRLVLASERIPKCCEGAQVSSFWKFAAVLGSCSIAARVCSGPKLRFGCDSFALRCQGGARFGRFGLRRVRLR